MTSGEDAPSADEQDAAESIADAIWEVGGTCGYGASSLLKIFGVDEHDFSAQTRRRIELALIAEGVSLTPRLSTRLITPKRIITARLDDEAMRLRENWSGGQLGPTLAGERVLAMTPAEVEAEFGGPGHYLARCEYPPDTDRFRWGRPQYLPTWILDGQFRVVALLATPQRAAASTLSQEWAITIERDARGWELVMTDARNGQRVVRARSRWLPNRYRVVIGARRVCELRKRVLRDDWTLLDARGQPVVEVRCRDSDAWEIAALRNTQGSRWRRWSCLSCRRSLPTARFLAPLVAQEAVGERHDSSAPCR